MKKNLIYLFFAVLTITAFSQKSNAQALFIYNNSAIDLQVIICGNTYTLAAGASTGTLPACSPAPCSYQVVTPRNPISAGYRTVTISIPSCQTGGCGSTNTDYIPAEVTSTYTSPNYTAIAGIDCSGNITVIIED